MADGHEAAHLERGYAFLVLNPQHDSLLISFTLSAVMHGSFQACLFGDSVNAELAARPELISIETQLP